MSVFPKISLRAKVEEYLRATFKNDEVNTVKRVQGRRCLEEVHKCVCVMAAVRNTFSSS